MERFYIGKVKKIKYTIQNITDWKKYQQKRLGEPFFQDAEAIAYVSFKNNNKKPLTPLIALF